MSLKFDCVVLAAGFGTRLGSFGESIPKGLIKVNDKQTLFGRLVDTVFSSGYKGLLSVVVNGRFNELYRKWKTDSIYKDKIRFFNNKVSDSKSRNGALKDLFLTISHFKLGDKPILVCPSDTYFDFNFSDFIRFCSNNPDKFIVVVRKMPSKDEIRGRLGCPDIENGRITKFVEKPEDPSSLYAIIPFYYYPPEYIKALDKYLKEGNNPDAPSNIIGWLLDNSMNVTPYIIRGKTIDVGTVLDVERLREI